MAETVVNNKLTINSGTKDRFRFILDRMPPSIVMPDYEGIYSENDNLKLMSVSVRKCTIPAIRQDENRIQTPIAEVTNFNYKVDFGSPMTVEYQMGDNLYMYNLFLLWMFMKSHPEMVGGLAEPSEKEKLLTSASIIVLDNNLDKTAEFQFQDVHPVGVGEQSFDFSDNEEKYGEVEFGYSYFLPKDQYEVVVT